jgi:indolepyruvate ferredoxin oxidoreductase beta subunit
MNPSFDILVVGIGGQGTILASNILGGACLAEGRSVRAAETHGMAQRGGSVESHVRIDGKYGPLIAPGTADLIIAFDLLEALRYSHYIKKGGIICVNRELVVPTSVYSQKLPIPLEHEIIQRLSVYGLLVVEAVRLAREAGSPLTANVVMLGAASPGIPIRPESLIEAIGGLVPAKTIEINRKAFDLGRGSVER